MSSNNTFSIIMATFNRAHLIEETLVSIQNQTYTQWECLIIDDGSSDATQTTLAPYLKKDPRFKYFQRPEKYKKGLPGCRNYGLDMVKGGFVIFFDDDDIVHPQNIELCIDVLEQSKSDFCIYKKQSFTGSFTESFEKQNANKNQVVINLYNFFTNKVPIASCTVMWHISCFDNIRFNENLMYAEEWECYLRILTTNKKGIMLNNILYFNRKHPQSNTGEFWNNDPSRKASKVEASRLILEHLANNKLLTYRLGVYFVSLALFLKEKQIFNYVKAHKNAFNTFDNWKLNIRYYTNGIIRPLYKIKKKIA